MKPTLQGRLHALFAGLASAAGLAGLLAATPAVAIELRVAAQPVSEPKFIISGGKVTGNCIDIFREIEKLDPDIKFVGDQQDLPLARIEALLAAGGLDVACGLIKNPDRLGRFTFPQTPAYVSKYLVAVRADDPVQVQNWDDIRKLGAQGVLLVNRASGPVKVLEALGGLQIDSGGADSKQNLAKLVAGRGRFFYYRSPGMMAEIKAAGVEGKVKVLPVVLSTENFYLMFNRSVPAATVDKVDKALAKLEQAGTLARFTAAYENNY